MNKMDVIFGGMIIVIGEGGLDVGAMNVDMSGTGVGIDGVNVDMGVMANGCGYEWSGMNIDEVDMVVVGLDIDMSGVE